MSLLALGMLFSIALTIEKPIGLGEPSTELVLNRRTQNTNGTFSNVRVVRVNAIYAPQVLIIEIYGSDIINWSAQGIEQRGAVLQKDVNKENVVSGLFPHPYGQYAISVVTKTVSKLDFRFRFK